MDKREGKEPLQGEDLHPLDGVVAVWMSNGGECLSFFPSALYTSDMSYYTNRASNVHQQFQPLDQSSSRYEQISGELYTHTTMRMSGSSSENIAVLGETISS